MVRLEGKIAIITGGARGMGASHARKFVEEGAKVVITDILEKDGEALANELGKNSLFVKHDVTNEDEWNTVVEKAEETFGFVNVLVNNAGIGLNKPIEEITVEEYMKVININQVGVLLGMKTVVPSMKKAKGGSIINISSLSGFGGTYGQVAYDASKFAVRGMTKTAALEFADHNIRVNSVHPGVIETPILIGHEETIKSISDQIPMKRIGQPEEVSKLIVFLASDESSFSTGSEFTIDGGTRARL